MRVTRVGALITVGIFLLILSIPIAAKIAVIALGLSQVALLMYLFVPGLFQAILDGSCEIKIELEKVINEDN